MKKAIFFFFLGMTQIFDETGIMIPVTVIEAGPMTVLRNKTVESDGYKATVVAFEDLPEKKVGKPEAGAFKKANVGHKKYIKEFKYDDEYEIGATITCEMFAAGDHVDVSGVTKGKGFSGAIKRWNQHRLKMTHGTGPVHRSLGSTGANSTPSKVIKGLHMAGQYGHENVTILNLEVVKVDAGKNVLLLKGAVPGPKNGLVAVRESVKAPKQKN